MDDDSPSSSSSHPDDGTTEEDRPSRLHIFKAETCYHGRHAERAFLSKLILDGENFLGIDRPSQYLLISGRSGSGKTSLIQHSRDWERERPCYLAIGKFEKTQYVAQPYSGLIAALTMLCEKWASTVHGRQEIITFRRMEARDVSALCSFLPSLDPILGETGTGSEGPLEDGGTALRWDVCSSHVENYCQASKEISKYSFQRLSSLIYKLLRFIVAGMSRPIVLLLDDIHWADQSSLNLIQFLVQEKDLRGVLFVGTYRAPQEGVTEHEGDQSTVRRSYSALRRHLNVLEKSPDTSRRLHIIHLSGFSLDELHDTFSLVVQKNKDDTLPLVKLIHEKTAGNPLFVEKFVWLLQQEGYLSYSTQLCAWEWREIEEIRNVMSIDNHDLVEVIASNLRFGDRETLDVLKAASCLGSQVPLFVLKEYFASRQLTEDSKWFGRNRVKSILECQVKKGVFRRPDGNNCLYTWANDGLQQAAYSLIEDYRREELHFHLGKHLLKLSSFEESEARKEFIVYLAADQLNRSLEFLLDEVGVHAKVELVELNLMAAKMSISKSDFYRAIDLLRIGIRLLDPDSKWGQATYALTLDLYNNLAEMEYTIGNLESAERTIVEILANATTLGDRYRAQSVLLEVAIHGKDRNVRRGADISRVILQSYKLFLPPTPGRLSIAIERRRLKKALPNGVLEDLVHMPIISEPTAARISALLGKLADDALLSGNWLLLKLAVLKMFNVACIYGIDSYIAMGVALYGIAQRKCGKFAKAFTTSGIAAEILKKLPKRPGDVRAKALMIIHSSLMSLKCPLEDSLEPFLESYNMGFQTADFDSALTAAMGYGYNYILVGKPLAPLADDMKSYAIEARQFGTSTSLQVQFVIIGQAVLNLQGKSSNFTFLKGDAMDQDEVLENEVEGQGRSMTLRDICIYRLMLSCIFRCTTTMRHMLDALAGITSFNPALARMHLRFVFTGYGAFQLFHKTREYRYNAMGCKALDYFKEATGKGSLNAYPMYSFLLAAKNPSKETFDEAIRVCSRSNLVNFQAMTNENAALYFLDQKEEKLAHSHLEEAVRLYEAWGASGKVKQLREEYSFILELRRANVLNQDSLRQKSDGMLTSTRNFGDNDKFDDSPFCASRLNSKEISLRTSALSGKFTEVTENDSGWDTECWSSNRTRADCRLSQRAE